MALTTGMPADPRRAARAWGVFYLPFHGPARTGPQKGGFRWNSLSQHDFPKVGFQIDDPRVKSYLAKAREIDAEYLRRLKAGEETGLCYSEQLATILRWPKLPNLLWSDVDFDDKSVTSRASVAKGKRSRRVLLDDPMLAMFRILREETDRRPEGWDHKHVFINQMGRPHRQNLLRKFYGTCKRAGIMDGKRNGAVDIHSLRVTFATLSLVLCHSRILGSTGSAISG